MQLPTEHFQLEKIAINMLSWIIFALLNLIINPLVSTHPKAFVITLILGLVIIPIFTRK